MQYYNEILRQIDIVNAALQKLGKQDIFNNSDVVIDAMSCEFYLQLRFSKNTEKKEHPRLEIILSLSGVEVNVDRLNEVFEWSGENINEYKTEIEDFFIMLLTSRIIAEYYGKNYTKISFFDTEGNCVQTAKTVSGFYSKTKKRYKTLEYNPFYEMFRF